MPVPDIEYRSVLRLGLLIRNRWMSQLDEIVPAVLECSNCSVHATVGGALSETVKTHDGLTKYSA